MSRSTREVFEDHLRRRAAGELKADLTQNYADDIVLLCDFAVLRGRDAVRESAARLRLQIEGGRYEYIACHVEGEYAFLKWRADAPDACIENGADSFVIRDGRIVMQSISYTVDS